MNYTRLTLVLACMACFALRGQDAQRQNPIETGAAAAPQVHTPESVPIYRVTVEQRAIRAVNYGHRSGPTKIDFRGTVLLPDARGEAKVESRQGAVQIDGKFEGLEAPTRFGAQYLTYVAWAITPEGRPVNLGEIVSDHENKGRLRVTTALQSFGLLVTAEPYFSVMQPSNVVVIENVVRSDTKGKVDFVEARYELLPRDQSPLHTQPVQVTHVTPEGRKVSLDEYEALVELYQARNAVQIAAVEEASRYAPQSFQKAEALLQQAEQLYQRKASKKRVVMTAREAAQTAEDARAVASKRKVQELPRTAETASR